MADKVRHGIIRTDLMMGTDVGTHLVSVRFYDNSGAEADIDNGNAASATIWAISTIRPAPTAVDIACTGTTSSA